MALLFVAGLLVVWAGANRGEVAVVVAWHLLGAGLGEEVFFRGYVQTRLDRAWGTPWRIGSVACGKGLLVGALLFALVHALDPAQYSAGIWQVNLAWGMATFVSGLLFGYLRARTGSIWAGVLLHGVGGAFRGVLLLVAGG